MKISKVKYGAIFILLCGALYAGFLYAQQSCRKTVLFAVGEVDGRFKIGSSDVAAVAEDAANRWNSQSGEILLKYDSKADLTINLIYDGRQADLDKLNDESQSLANSKTSVENMRANFENLLSQYQRDLANYNNSVSYWNGQGGAPPSAYDNLQNQKTVLDRQRQTLIDMSNALNIKIGDYNSDLTNLQSEIDSRKNVIVTQGLYYPAENKIDIFTFGSREELRLVLMHELGHSLGLGHIQNPLSIMYYLLSEQSLSDPQLTDEDKSELNNRCSLGNYHFYVNIFKLGKQME